MKKYKAKKRKFNPKWFRHEALHTTHVCLDMISSHIEDHHYFSSGINPKFNEEIVKAQEALAAAYQLIGADRKHEIKKQIKVKF